MSGVRVAPCAGVRGTLSVPGDKSISHRAAILSAIASGTSSITGFLESEDCLNTLKVLEQVGAQVRRESGRIIVTGCGGAFHRAANELDCGNSGTGMRLLAGLLAGQPFESVLTGDESLKSRPMKRIKEPLELMGAEIRLTGDRGCAPVMIKGSRLRGISYKLPMASAQVKSCTLLAGLFADGPTSVVEPKATRDHTERMLADAGADIEVDGLKVTLKKGRLFASLKSRDWVVPGDFSSAAFWIVCAAVREGSEVILKNTGLNPRRTALLDVLKRMGAQIEVKPGNPADSELAGDILVRGCRLHGTEIGGSEIPNLIDEIPILAVAAGLAGGRTVIRDAEELRVKESDRIAVMAASLNAAGVDVKETSDGMVIEGTGRIRGGADIQSMGDHRIAMAMTVAGLCSEKGMNVCNTDCVLTSYPSFWTDMQKVTGGSRG
jgi:3-phosphoshikimate 1-carboxyvinyltransferase